MKHFKLYLTENLKIKCIISFILAMFLSLGNIVSKDTNNTITIKSLGILLSAFVFFYIFLSLLYGWFNRIAVKESKTQISGNKIYWYSFIALTFFYFIEFLGLYPGIFAYDAPYQFNMYLLDQISEWHPVLHTVMIGKVMEAVYSMGFDLLQGIAVITVIQFLLSAFCFSYTLKYIYVRTSSYVIWIISLLFLAAFPTISLQVMSITKDSFFMIFFVLSMTLTVELLDETDKFLNNKIKQIVYVLSVFFMIVYRNNCIYAIPFLIIPVVFVCKKTTRALSMFLSVILLFALYKLVYVNIYVTVPVDGREMLSVPAQQLSSLYNDDSAVLTAEQRQVILDLFGEKALNNFTPESADIAKGTIGMEYYRANQAMVRKVWLDAIINNPAKSMLAFAKLNYGFWYPFTDLTMYMDGSKAYWQVYSIYPYRIIPKIPILYSFYTNFMYTDFSNLYLVPLYLIFAPAVFFYIFVIMVGYAIINKNRSFLVVYIFTVFYWMTFLLGPVALVRYTTYLYALCPLYFVLLIDRNKKGVIHEGFPEQQDNT